MPPVRALPTNQLMPAAGSRITLSPPTPGLVDVPERMSGRTIAGNTPSAIT